MAMFTVWPVLLQVAQPVQGGHVAVHRAAVQAERPCQVADPDQRLLRPKRRQDQEAALERLGLAAAIVALHDASITAEECSAC
jgi:hypothetical protein